MRIAVAQKHAKTLVVQTPHGQIDGRSRHPACLIGSHEDRHVGHLLERHELPGGLWPEELSEALGVALASPLAVGMEVTIYNPTFDDAERSAARTLARAVATAFSRAV